MRPTKPIARAQRRWVEVNLAGARFHNVDLTDARIRGAFVDGVTIDGLVTGLTVNGVDVVPFVEAELDRRHPERVALRAGTADGLRRAWDLVSARWQDLDREANRRPVRDLTRSVDEEWSYLETLRHLVFVVDAWFSRCVLRDPAPFWPAGLAATDLPHWFPSSCGLDPRAHPSLHEVREALATRRAAVEDHLAHLQDEELAAPCRRNPATGYPADTSKYTVGHCLAVVVSEEFEHGLIAARDLAALD